VRIAKHGMRSKGNKFRAGWAGGISSFQASIGTRAGFGVGGEGGERLPAEPFL